LKEYIVPIIILVSFLILFWSHYKAVKIGFDMGCKTDFQKVQSAVKTSKPDVLYVPEPSDLDKEALDYE